MSEPWREISRFSRKLYEKGYMGSHSGNLSVRVGDVMYIKRRGAAADEIGPEDVIEVPLKGESSSILLSSSETEVHKMIYNATSALAVVHAHPPYSVVCSLLYEEVVPLDEEGELFLHKIPVVSVGRLSGSKELGERVSEALKSYRVVLVRAHGTFAVGKLLEEAYHATCAAEESCRVRYLVDVSGRRPMRELEELRGW